LAEEIGEQMSTHELIKEIKDINLNYLMLAQHMIRNDKDMAIYRLGISEEIAELLESLSVAQIMKLANTPSMLTRFRFDDALILGMLTHNNKSISMTHAHASIFLANQEVETIS
jgi:flagellar transcriptional activator FlhD